MGCAGSKVEEKKGAASGGEPLYILYGSQTGTAESFASMVGTYAASHDFKPVVMTLNDSVAYIAANIKKDGEKPAAVIIITSTYGIGEFPSNAAEFPKALAAGKLDALKDIPYAILGLGNSKNENYNAAAKDLDEKLGNLGAKTLTHTKLSCELQDGGHDPVFRSWKRSIFALLGKKGSGAAGKLGSTYLLVQQPAEAAAALPKREGGFISAKVVKNQLLTPGDYPVPGFNITFKIPAEDQKTMLGGRRAMLTDQIEIVPIASDDLVARAAKRLGVKESDIVTIEPQPGAAKRFFDNKTVTIRDILANIIDISAVPTRSLLESVAMIATDENDKNALQDLADDLSADSNYDKLTSGVFTIVDALEMFPKLEITLPQLLSHAPHVAVRTYSIANDVTKTKNSEEENDDEFDVCFTVPKRTRDERTHVGLCTGMLEHCAVDAEVQLRLVATTALKSPAAANPLLAIAIGSGIGSVRAILQQRHNATVAGEAVGHAKVYFGFRHSGKSDYFRDELSAFDDVEIKFVGSHDQEDAYVTPMDKLDASVVEFLGENGEVMYCGQGGSVPLLVESSLRKTGIDISALRNNGRYHEEYFTPDLDMENQIKSHSGAVENAATLAARFGKCDMFCFQCEQTFKGKGCYKIGVCGKTPRVAALQDLTMQQCKVLGFYLHELRTLGAEENAEANRYTLYALFATLTNVNFDETRFTQIVAKLKGLTHKARAQYVRLAKEKDVDVKKQPTPPVSIDEGEEIPDMEGLVERGKNVGVLSRFTDAATQSAAGVAEMLIYGIKGIAAYTDHSLMNNKENDEIYEFIHRALHLLSGEDQFDLGKCLEYCLEAGKVNVASMGMLYESNKTLGVPEISTVSVKPKPGKCILISGHDLIIMKALLEKTEPLGINVYTHGEMLPGHGYPELKKFTTLAGNFGGAWMRQAVEFPHFPGPVLLTTNCLTEPHDSYRDRLFTVGAVGWQGIPHIGNTIGDIDFAPLIESAQKASGYTESDKEFSYADPVGMKRPENFTVGFGHETVLSVAPTIIEEIEKGNITRFFVVGGCDGFEGQRSYYTDLVAKLPKTAVVLTVGCGKFRFNHMDLGTIGETGIPRILDMGQCNDSFSAVQVALALAGALKCEVADLPLSIVLSWFEQKAVAVLLSLLHLGLKPIYVGPSLPAFVTPEVLDVLVTKFGVRPCGNPEEDLKVMLEAKGMGWEA